MIVDGYESIKPVSVFEPINIVVHDPDEGNLQETVEVQDFITTQMLHVFCEYYLFPPITDHDDQYELEHEGA